MTMFIFINNNNVKSTWPKCFCQFLHHNLYHLCFREIILLLGKLKLNFPASCSFKSTSDFPWHSSVLTANFENYKHGHPCCSLPFSSKRFQLWTSVVYKCSAWRLPDLFCIFYFKAKAARKPSEFHAGISWTFSSPADNCYSGSCFQRLSWFKIWP